MIKQVRSPWGQDTLSNRIKKQRGKLGVTKRAALLLERIIVDIDFPVEMVVRSLDHVCFGVFREVRGWTGFLPSVAAAALGLAGHGVNAEQVRARGQQR